MKKKIAIFKAYGMYESPCCSDCIPDTYIRLTEWVDVDFPDREKADCITDEVNSINKEIAEIKENAINKVNALSKVKEELLALEVNHENQIQERNNTQYFL